MHIVVVVVVAAGGVTEDDTGTVLVAAADVVGDSVFTVEDSAELVEVSGGELGVGESVAVVALTAGAGALV